MSGENMSHVMNTQFSSGESSLQDGEGWPNQGPMAPEKPRYTEEHASSLVPLQYCGVAAQQQQ
jgi:hypothetical protein